MSNTNTATVSSSVVSYEKQAGVGNDGKGACLMFFVVFKSKLKVTCKSKLLHFASLITSCGVTFVFLAHLKMLFRED